MGWTSVSGVKSTNPILPYSHHSHTTDASTLYCGLVFQLHRKIIPRTSRQFLRSVALKQPSPNIHDRRPILSRPGLKCSNTLDILIDAKEDTEVEVKPAEAGNSTSPLLRSPPSRTKRTETRQDAVDVVVEGQSMSPLATQMHSSFRSPMPAISDWSKRSPTRSPTSPSGHPKAMFRTRVNAFLKALSQADGAQNGGAALFRTLDSFKSRLNDQDMCILLREAPHWSMSLKYWSWMKQQVDYRPDHFHYNVMIGLLGAAGRWKQVVSLAEQAQVEGLKPDAIMYTLLIRNASGLGHHDAAVEWYHRMRASQAAMDETSYRTAMKALGKAGRMGDALELFREMPSLGLPPDAKTASVLVACCRGEGEEVERVGDALVRASLSERGVVSRNHYYALMLVYKGAGWPQRVQHLYTEMTAERRLHPDAQLCRLVIEALLQAGLKAEAETVFADMKRIYGRQISSNIYKAMMGGSDRWQTDGRRVELYEEMMRAGLKADLGIFNQMVGVFARGGTEGSTGEWLSLMERHNCPPSLETYRSAVAGCRPGGRYRVAGHLLRRLHDSGLKYREDSKLLCLLLSLVEQVIESRGRAEAEQAMECVQQVSPTAVLLLSGGGFEARGGGGARREALQAKARRLLQDSGVFASVVNIFWATGLRRQAAVVVRHGMRTGDLRRVQGLKSSAEEFRLPPGLSTGVCHVAVREWMFRLKRRFSQDRQKWGREVVEERGRVGKVVIRFRDTGATAGLGNSLVAELRRAGAPFRVERGDAGEVQLHASRVEMEEWLKTESAAIEQKMEDDVKPEFEGWLDGMCVDVHPLHSGCDQL